MLRYSDFSYSLDLQKALVLIKGNGEFLHTYVFPGVLNFCFSVNIYVFGSKGDFLYPTAFFEFCKV